MMEKDYFKNIVKEQFKEEGNSIYKNNEKFISNNIKNSDDTYIIETNFSNFYKGSFYFLYYDLAGKSSNMEKFNPVILLDKFNINGVQTYYVLNLNFLPIAIRVLFFNNILNYNLNEIEKNKTLNILQQEPLHGINFINVYKMLKRIGFEWAIRKLDAKSINKIYKISTNILSKFITMSTASFTKVDDNKLIQIWQKKIKEQTDREKKLINDLINDFEKMSNDFEEQYKDLNTRSENLEKSLEIIKNF